MKLKIRTIFTTLFLLSSSYMITACEKTNPVSYSNNIRAIFEKNCVECHLPGGAGESISGYNLENYEGVMRGTKFGPVIIPGDSLSSTLIILVENRADPSIKMPHGNRPALSKSEIQSLKDWINQGAKNN